VKLRSIIFLILFALGVIPILTLVAINLAGHIERHENAALVQMEERARSDLHLLNSAVHNLRNNFLHAASLVAILYPPQKLNNGFGQHKLGDLLTQWFNDDPTILEFHIYDLDGNQKIRLTRNHANSFSLSPVVVENFQDADWFQKTCELGSNQYHSAILPHPGTDNRKVPEGYFLQLTAPLLTQHGTLQGAALLRINLASFLHEQISGYWILADGRLINNTDENMPFTSVDVENEKPKQVFQSGFEKFPTLKSRLGKTPLIFDADHDQKITWIPLLLTDDVSPAMWIGKMVDRSAVEKWKKELIFNIIGIVFCVMLAVLFIARGLAAKADRIKEDILTGLDAILTEKKPVTFSWTGPRELQMLAADLTRLASQYAQASQARKQAEAALSESEIKFRNLTASAQDGIAMMDHQGDISYWNEAAEQIFGYASEEVLGKPIHTLISPRLPPEIDERNSIHSRPTREGPIRETMELLTTSKDGKTIPIELSLSEARIRDQWHSMWIIRNITERKEAEQKARIQQQQLIQADKMVSLGLLISGVAHEINNPNSIAMLNTAMLARSWESTYPILEEYYSQNGDFSVAGIDYSEMREQIPRLLAELDESTRRIKHIVHDLKDYARQDTSRQTSDVDLNEIVEAAIRLTYNQIKKSTGSFSKTLEAELPKIKGNRQRLEQVVINLIQNSCEALRSKEGKISIATEYNSKRQTVAIRISDTGVGIPPQSINMITDPFFTTKRNVGGTGLGLSVSAGIVKEHNGLMEFTSELGHGTTALLSFPVPDTDEKVILS